MGDRWRVEVRLQFHGERRVQVRSQLCGGPWEGKGEVTISRREEGTGEVTIVLGDRWRVEVK